MANPLETPGPWELAAKNYAEVTAPFFRNYATVALDRAGLPSGARVLDIAAGPGTLSVLAAQRGCMTTAVDFSPAMLAELTASAAAAGVSIEAKVGDGQALPLADASFDAAFCMFGLIFFPDRARGLREMVRVLVPGGVAVMSSWQPIERFPMLCDVMAAVRELLPQLPFAGAQPVLASEEHVVEEMTEAGLVSVAAEQVSARFDAASLEEAWHFMSHGSAPMELLRRNLGGEPWRKLEQAILESLRRKHGSGPQRLNVVANLGVGRKPAG